MISLKHISTLSTFNQTKFSADSTDSSYFLGSDQTQIFQGTPDVKYNDLCYIKCSNLQYTHGHLYGSTEVGEAHVSLTQEEYDALSEEEKNNGKIYLIKESTIPDLIDQLPLATTSTNGLMSAEDKERLDANNFVGDFTSGSIENIINTCVSKEKTGCFYINLETTTGTRPSSAGAAFIQYWSSSSQTGCICLYAHKINTNTAYRGYMANNVITWVTDNIVNISVTYGNTKRATQTKDVDYWGCNIPPVVSGYVKINRYVEILSGADKIAAACPAYSEGGVVNVITKLFDSVSSATFSIRVCDVYLKY